MKVISFADLTHTVGKRATEVYMTLTCHYLLYISSTFLSGSTEKDPWASRHQVTRGKLARLATPQGRREEEPPAGRTPYDLPLLLQISGLRNHKRDEERSALETI